MYAALSSQQPINLYIQRRAYSSSLSTANPLTIEELRATMGRLPSIDPQWLRGFVDGEGTFYIGLRPNTSNRGYRVELSFIIKQATVSASCLFAIREFFGKGNVRFDDANKNYLRFEIKSHEAIIQQIIPFFEKYPLLTSKQLNYLDFKKVAELIQEGRHLTEEGILEIKKIKAGMNTGRSFVSKLEYMNSIKDHMVLTPGWLSGFMDALIL